VQRPINPNPPIRSQRPHMHEMRTLWPPLPMATRQQPRASHHRRTSLWNRRQLLRTRMHPASSSWLEDPHLQVQAQPDPSHQKWTSHHHLQVLQRPCPRQREELLRRIQRRRPIMPTRQLVPLQTGMAHTHHQDRSLQTNQRIPPRPLEMLRWTSCPLGMPRAHARRTPIQVLQLQPQPAQDPQQAQLPVPRQPKQLAATVRWRQWWRQHPRMQTAHASRPQDPNLHLQAQPDPSYETWTSHHHLQVLQRTCPRQRPQLLRRIQRRTDLPCSHRPTHPHFETQPASPTRPHIPQMLQRTCPTWKLPNDPNMWNHRTDLPRSHRPPNTHFETQPASATRPHIPQMLQRTCPTWKRANHPNMLRRIIEQPLMPTASPSRPQDPHLHLQTQPDPSHETRTSHNHLQVLQRTRPRQRPQLLRRLQRRKPKVPRSHRPQDPQPQAQPARPIWPHILQVL